ncbi:MAG: BON domain-containing protein, partial [Candidatus Dormibacterales bacterium]
DRRSRAALQGGLVRIQGQARHRVPALVDRAGGTLEELRSRWSRSSSGADEAALRASVESAVKAADGADALEVGVEGRTVYLKGMAGERSALEGAIERARQVEGVAAVINLASLPSQGPSAGRRRG